MTQRKFTYSLVVLFIAAEGCTTIPEHAIQGGVNIVQEPARLVINVGGKPFAEYHYRDVPRPFFYPVLGPGGEPMTRHWPMENVPGEDQDHPHHRSLWYAHGDLNGYDFWSEGPKSGKTVHEAFLDLQSGAQLGFFTEKNNWITREGKLVCEDVRKIRIYNRAATERLLDFDITFKAVNGDLTFGDTKEGSMAIRIAESMKLTQSKGKPPGQGHIINSEGVRDDQTWGKRAKWCDYYGPVNGKIVGIAIFDHPSNPKHPTWWHVRDYGLFAANPFGVHDFEKKAAGAGNFTIPAGKSARFRYRFYFHEGDEQRARVGQRYEEYVAEKLNP